MGCSSPSSQGSRGPGSSIGPSSWESAAYFGYTDMGIDVNMAIDVDVW